MIKDPRLIRLDATRLKIVNDQHVDATLFVNEQVPVESTAVDELVGLVDLQETTERLAENDPKFFDEPPILKKIAVTPVDLRRPDIAMRRDIVEKKLEDIKKESPDAYKGIGPIVDTLTQAGIAVPVAELTPLMTVKG
ncbi:MAG: hypothetical protein JWN24_4291 [Phycisphaerales bacterium]|nr:hypothetical protein [Phycisphaerales bacterium]